MNDRQTRRAMMAGACATALSVALSPIAARAQSRRGSPVDVRIPDSLQGLLPAGATDTLTTIEQLIALEREADTRNLPQSVLQFLSGGGLPSDLDELYRLALPRLVALIDRASVAGPRRAGGIADRAAELLAGIHGGEHQTPDALRLSGSDAESILDGLPRPDIGMPPPIVPEQAPVLPVTPIRSTRYAQLSDEYAALFDSARVREDREDTARWHLAMLRQSRPRYERVAARTGVPWYFIGATHGLEASFNFRGHLHNGDYPLTARTRQVPAGRPTVWLPPSDWESSAVDAMRHMGFAGQGDWTLTRTLYRFEAYNGFGYRGRGVPTPYLWSFSNHYERGKFVADGRWSAAARSQQCGAAVMLKLLVEAGDVEIA